MLQLNENSKLSGHHNAGQRILYLEKLANETIALRKVGGIKQDHIGVEELNWTGENDVGSVKEYDALPVTDVARQSTERGRDIRIAASPRKVLHLQPGKLQPKKLKIVPPLSFFPRINELASRVLTVSSPIPSVRSRAIPSFLVGGNSRVVETAPDWCSPIRTVSIGLTDSEHSTHWYSASSSMTTFENLSEFGTSACEVETNDFRRGATKENSSLLHVKRDARNLITHSCEKVVVKKSIIRLQIHPDRSISTARERVSSSLAVGNASFSTNEESATTENSFYCSHPQDSTTVIPVGCSSCHTDCHPTNLCDSCFGDVSSVEKIDDTTNQSVMEELDDDEMMEEATKMRLERARRMLSHTLEKNVQQYALNKTRRECPSLSEGCSSFISRRNESNGSSTSWRQNEEVGCAAERELKD